MSSRRAPCTQARALDAAPQPCLARLVAMPVRRLVSLAVLLCLLLAAPASASRTQSLTFEAPRDLMNPVTAPAALDGARVARRALAARHPHLARRRARPERRASAELRADRPRRATTGASTTPLLAAAKDARLAGPADDLRPGAEVGDRSTKLDNVTRPSPTAFAAFMTAVGRKYGAQVDHVGDLERAQPAAVPAPAVRRRRQGRVAARSTASSTSPACAGCRRPARATTRSSSARRRRAARRASSRRCASCAAMLCLDARYKKRRQVRRAERRRLRAPRLHDAPGPVLQAAAQDDVTIGVLSRLTTALDRARGAGALTSGCRST